MKLSNIINREQDMKINVNLLLQKVVAQDRDKAGETLLVMELLNIVSSHEAQKLETIDGDDDLGVSCKVELDRGYDKVGFVQKNLYNKIDLELEKLISTWDAKGVVAYLSSKIDSYSVFFYKYLHEEDGRLHLLIWWDYCSKLDYNRFHGALIFDTNYHTNDYYKLLLVFAGINNHYFKVVFGCALMAHEDIKTYDWVMGTILEAMNNKKPTSVMTNDDSIIRKAIKKHMPELRHRICAWYLQRNGIH
ncbi:hypothetical protein ACH5RR_029153 [Cinchona calisaya]|uniref:MULE transposase domain-containing protein n=1 Tax=Cinchona calisaya TaxID=153742 RepID=A0ABD2YU40_9GENT